MPFAKLVGLDLMAVSPEEVRGRLEWAPERCTSNGVLHGAALITLADTLGAICAFMNLPAGAGTATIESKTNFFRAVSKGHVDASTHRCTSGGQP